MNEIIFGDCRDTLRRLAADGARAQTCVTSPPYFGLRDYGVAGQLGLESTPAEYVATMVDVFRCVRDVLADDGTLWLNIGDSYAGSRCGGDSGASTLRNPGQKIDASHAAKRMVESRRRDNAPIPRSDMRIDGFKPKDLIGIPWRLAFALQDDGWYLRQDIVWHKPNPMPESVRDRCTKAHEYLFLLSKSKRYFYDAEAVKEPAVSKLPAGNGFAGRQGGSDRVGPLSGGAGSADRWNGVGGSRNRRSVWTVATKPYSGAHFATFPPALIEPCVLAGSRPGDVVLDPFMGSGTTAAVAIEHGRQYLGCELNPGYAGLQAGRIHSAIKSREAQLSLIEASA